MPVRTVCLSHSPIKGLLSPQDKEAERDHDQAIGEIGRWISAFDPELFVVFGPDHYHGFFYELMPPFCIGVEAEALGDWNGPRGKINVPSDLALDCVKFLQSRGFDVPHSRRMICDHGIAQPLGWLDIDIGETSILPIFVDCAGEPQPPMERVRKLGVAVGEFLKGLDKRVLVIGSGGLSHDPPTPRFDQASDEVKRMMIDKRGWNADEEEGFKTFAIAEAKSMAKGTSACLAPSEEWDRKFLAVLESQDLESIDGMYTNEDIYREGGCGGHEIRTWVAACAAQQAAEGRYDYDLLYYRVVPEWFAGMGVMRASPPAA